MSFQSESLPAWAFSPPLPLLNRTLPAVSPAERPAAYAQKLTAAKAYLGQRWVLHPENHVRRRNATTAK